MCYNQYTFNNNTYDTLKEVIVLHYYAHSANASGEWEPLEVHLRKTASLAENFADAFGEGTAGKWLGLFHDIGKASPLFQEVLYHREHRINHWAAGAALLRNHRLLSRVVYAHHKGIVWDITDDLERSLQEHGACDSQAGRRFSVSGPQEYRTAAAEIRRQLPMKDGTPALHENGTSFLKEKISIGLIPYAQAMLLARHMRGDLDGYPPFVWR